MDNPAQYLFGFAVIVLIVFFRATWRLLFRRRKSSSDDFYESWAWRTVRYKALKKHGRRCMVCGAVPTKRNGVVITVDHIKPRSKYPRLALKLNNLQVLCMKCNQGKGAWDQSDWRNVS